MVEILDGAERVGSSMGEILDRAERIGSSMVYGIAVEGGHQAYDLLVNKQGVVPNDAMDRGTAFEQPIMDLASKNHGWENHKAETIRWEKNGVPYRNTADFWAWTKGNESNKFLCEVKSHAHWIEPNYGANYSDAVPERVTIQCQMHCFANNMDSCRVVSHFGVERPRVFEVGFDPELWGIIERRCELFWHKHVLTKIRPPADKSESCTDLLKHVKQVDAELVDGGDDLDKLDDELQAIAASDKVNKCRKAEIQNILRERIGEHDGVQSGDVIYTARFARNPKPVIDKKGLIQRLAQEQPGLLEEFTSTPTGGRRLQRRKVI